MILIKYESFLTTEDVISRLWTSVLPYILSHIKRVHVGNVNSCALVCFGAGKSHYDSIRKRAPKSPDNIPSLRHGLSKGLGNGTMYAFAFGIPFPSSSVSGWLSHIKAWVSQSMLLYRRNINALRRSWLESIIGRSDATLRSHSGDSTSAQAWADSDWHN